MSKRKKVPNSNFLSIKNIVKIMFLMALFIVMVQNNGFENLILIFCLIMFVLPKFIPNKLRLLASNPKVALDKLQNFANALYLAKVVNADNEKDKTYDSFDKLNGTDLSDPFGFQDPPDFFLANVTHEEVWGNYTEPKLDSDSTDDKGSSNAQQ